MKLPRRLLWWVGLPLAVLAAVIGLSLAVGGDYSTEQTAKRTFTIDEDFTSVRKILVRTNASQQIITMGGTSEFIDQKWSAIGGELDPARLLEMMMSPDWRLELHGTLRVRTLDEYIGQLEIDLSQDVEIEPDFLHSDVRLDEPAGRLEDYHMITRFSRDEATGKTRVELSLTQRIRTHAPWFAHAIADRRVLESAERTLRNQERATRALVAEHIDDVPLLPLR